MNFNYNFCMNQKKDQVSLKVIIIGDSGVGKTNFLLRFCENSFKNNYIATIGVDFKIKTITVKNQRVKLQIWDTAGQERFKNVTQVYYKGVAAIILLYSVTDSKSYENIERWIKQANENAPKDVVKMLIGNKCEVDVDRQVSTSEGENLAKSFGISFLQASAKSGYNVNETFLKLGENLLENYISKRIVVERKIHINSSSLSAKQSQSCKC